MKLVGPLGLLLLFLPLIATGQTAPPATAPVAQSDSDALIPRDTLEEMYRRELGVSTNPDLVDKLYRSHLLIEQYFKQPSLAQRKKIVEQIDAIGVNPNLLGRIVRLRMNWPELAPGVYMVNESFGPFQVHYFLGVPRDYDRSKPYPLVIKLPEPQSFLGDPRPNVKQIRQMYTDWIDSELQAHPDALVLMPLPKLDLLYGPSDDGMNSVIQAMLHAADKVNIDPARVYLTGHGVAADAVWNLAVHYPTYFAAINPLAGSAHHYWQRLRLANLRNTLPVVWHDLSDKVVHVQSARDLVRALHDLKIDVVYDETKDLGHDPSPAVISTEYDKMCSHVRELYPTDISAASNRLDTIFNRVDWVQMDQPTDPGKDERTLFPGSGGVMILFQNPMTLDAHLDDSNTITSRSHNLASFRIDLNDQMVDFNKPVAVIVDGKQRFKGIVKPTTTEMLESQLFLGRGWRYFTASIDIDLDTFPKPATQPTTQSSTRPTGKIEYITPGGEVRTYEPRAK